MRNNKLVDTIEYSAPPDQTTIEGRSLASVVQVDFGALSHPGNVRPNNEDHYLAARFDRTMQTLLTNLAEGVVPVRHTDSAYGMLVADGMGGQAAGEVASSAAIGKLIELILSTPDWIMRLDDKGMAEVVRRTEHRIQQVTESLRQLAGKNSSLFGMGTTMTLACSLGDDMIIGHVGDSRAYLFRNNELKRMTRDHTVVQALISMGSIRPAEAATHPLRHVLLNVIGTRGDPVRVEIDQLKLADGDQILLCTDGLTDMLTDTLIAEVLQRSMPAATACQALVEMALQAGGKDNVTVVLARYAIPH